MSLRSACDGEARPPILAGVLDATAHAGGDTGVTLKGRPATLAETAEGIRVGETSSMAIGEFLDAYYAANLANRPAMYSDQPSSVDLLDSRKTQVIDAYLSAIAEALT